MRTELEIFALRLKQARILKKLSMDKLVEVIGGLVSKQAISKYESAKMLPNSTVLLALSAALDVEPDYFFRPFSFDLKHFDVSFRKKSDTSSKDINALKVQIQDQVERYLEIEEVLGRPVVGVQRTEGEILFSPEQMCQLAREIRIQWNLGEDAIANVQDTLEAKGIKVISTEAPEGFDGVSGVINGKEYVVVFNNVLKHVERRRFTGMHELAHLLCGDRFSEKLTLRQKEKLCDSFANEMLLPTSALRKAFEIGDRISLSELRQLQLIYGISIDAIMHKLQEIGIVSESKYKSYCINKSKNEILKQFVEESVFVENYNNRFETMVLSAAAKGLISTSKAASLLHSTVSTVRNKLCSI